MSLRKSLITATAVAALALPLAGPALATSPVPVEPKGPDALAIPPKIDSGLEFLSPTQSHTKTSFTIGWQAKYHKASFQMSTQKPVKKDGKWAFPGQIQASQIVLGQSLQPGNINGLAQEQATYGFEKTVDGLAPDTTYYAVARLALSNKYEPVEQAWEIRTSKQLTGDLDLKTQSTRTVQMTVKKVHIVKDGDSVGKGEARFGVRLAPEGNIFTPSYWGAWSHGVYDYMKVDSGSTYTLPKPLTHTITTTRDIAVVEVQGFENDVFKQKWCPVEGGPSVGQQFSDNCWDASVAQLVVSLPDSTEPTTKTVLAKVQRNPDFEFSAVVEVRSWINH